MSVEAVVETSCGDLGSENAGMSNERWVRILIRRMPKVSWVKFVCSGLVGT